ncbi:hypothetical protein L6164_021444 [Bauhinia variegata]|uniref:Uncharacterized protein n=1 Tax=Bauhinia variegata TaxID=167791 RepID=A0ACB9N420_BAUVA|nr:hypothetical protein L6164_021444 [Bauhinia variegata]
MNMNISSRNGNGTTQACAPCKYQRRKCASDCILAPYFPHDRHKQFINAHKLFGVSNINKIVKNLSPLQKDQAMRTVIIESDIRANDPVGGCCRIIQALQAEIEYCKAELDLVLQQLAIVRAQAQAHHVYDVDDHRQHQVINGAADPLNLYNPAAPSHYHYHYLQPQQGDHRREQYIMAQLDDSHNTLQQQDVSAWTMHNSVSLSLHGNNNGHGGADDYDHDQKPIVFQMPCDERNELRFQPQELVDRSDEGVLFKVDDGEVINAEPECMQLAVDQDLKGAATLFTLTNCTSCDQVINSC